MNINLEMNDDLTILNMDGALDINGIKTLKENMQTARQNKAKKVILNFEDVSTVQSSILKDLLTPLRAMTLVGGIVGICGMSTGVHKILQTGAFYQHVKVYENLEDAKKEMGAL